MKKCPPASEVFLLDSDLFLSLSRDAHPSSPAPTLPGSPASSPARALKPPPALGHPRSSSPSAYAFKTHTLQFKEASVLLRTPHLVPIWLSWPRVCTSSAHLPKRAPSGLEVGLRASVGKSSSPGTHPGSFPSSPNSCPLGGSWWSPPP